MNDSAEMKKQEREQVIELGSDLTKSGKGNKRHSDASVFGQEFSCVRML